MELVTGVQENNEDRKAVSREERLRKYALEKEKRKYVYYGRKPPLAVTKRLERRAKQRAFKKMTPEEQAKYRECGNHRTKRRAWISIAGNIKYCSNFRGTRWIPILRKVFTPTGKFKDNTVVGPFEGKGSRKLDYHPSVIDTVAGQFNPSAVADKSETHIEKILKKKKYGDKIRREKFTKPDKPIGRECGIYIYIEETDEPKHNTKQEDAEPDHEVKDYEEKLHGIIDGLDQKSANGRASNFTALQAALSRRLVTDTVLTKRCTVTYALERALKKGRSDEQLAAARLAPILCIQLGENHCEQFVREVKSAFINIITNNTIDARVRAECCQSLAAISVLSRMDTPDILDLMTTYETLCSESNSKNNCNIHKNADSTIQTAALNAWALLLALCSPADVHSLLDRTSSTTLFLSRLTELLQAPTVQVRMAAGIALTLAYELGLEYSEKFGQDKLIFVISEVEQLTQDSHKFRARKDCKIQRKTFRNVLRTLQEKTAPVERVYIGKERLELDRWSCHVLYRRLAAALNTGLQVATGTNLLRSALRMEPLVEQDTHHKHNKQEKHRQNANASKARSILRKKNRDKRYVDFDLDL